MSSADDDVTSTTSSSSRSALDDSDDHDREHRDADVMRRLTMSTDTKDTDHADCTVLLLRMT